MPILEKIPWCGLPTGAAEKRRKFTFLEPADLSHLELEAALASIEGSPEAHKLIKVLLIDCRNYPTPSMELTQRSGARTPLIHWRAQVDFKWKEARIDLRIAREPSVDFHQAKYQIWRIRRH